MLEPILEKISSFDLVDLIATVGALQLHSPNVHHSVRIDVLAHVACSLKYQGGKPKISKHTLNKILNERPLGGGSPFQQYEDPSPNLFTEAITFVGGNYIVFPGILEDTTHILKTLNLAMFFSSEFKNAKDLILNAHNANLAILGISNEIARRIGVDRYEVLPNATQEIAIPKDLAIKKQAVIFTKDQIENIIKPIPWSVVEEFIVEAGDSSIQSFSPENGPLHKKPLVRIEDLIVVIEPWMLLDALRHRLLVIANQFGLLHTLGAEYKEAIIDSVSRSLRLFDHHLLKVELPFPPDQFLVDQHLWSLDIDKVMYSITFFDDLKEFNEEDIFTDQDNSKDGELLKSHLVAIEDFVFANLKETKELFIIVIFSSLGRKSWVKLDVSGFKTTLPILGIRAYELEILSYLEIGDPMILYKFSLAKKKLSETAQIISWSTLGEFEIYKENRYSFYFNDEERPQLVAVGTECGGKIYAESIKKTDMHAVPYLIEGSYIEVVNIERMPAIPIYMPNQVARIGRRVQLFVDIFPPTWVCAKEETLGSDRLTIYHPDLAEFVHMVAYWLWQFHKELTPFLVEASLNMLCLEIDIDLDDSWDVQSSNYKSESSLLSYMIRDEKIFIRINPPVVQVMASQDNKGELQFMGLVLVAIAAYLESINSKEIAGELKLAIPMILAKHLEDPHKKKLLAVDTNYYPGLIPTKGTSYRKVNDFDIGVLLDELGDFLTKQLKLPVGPIPKEEINSVLQKIVEFYFQEFITLVESLSPDNLLDFLISNYEKIVHSKTHRDLTVSTQLSCYRTVEGFHELLSEQMSGFNQASRACRFIIEYVVAKPPSGVRPVSYAVYDRLLALAAEMIVRGSHSDMKKYELQEVRMSILKSGRLGVNNDEITAPQKKYWHSATREHIKHAKNSFKGWWKERKETGSDDLPVHIVEANSAFTAEFGISLTDLANFIAQISDFSKPADELNQLNKYKKTELIEGLVEKLGWEIEKINICLDFLILKPRQNFLNPSAPFRNVDVYPWRLGRGLSYMRRPLLELHEGGDILIGWGMRHLYEAFEYIKTGILNGRLQPYYNSDLMKSWQGKLSAQDGKEFISQVLDVIPLSPQIIVKTNVKKVGSERIADLGNELGDIDVLLIIPKRKRILLIECKNIGVARTPFEMKRELDYLFLGTSNRLSTIVKHQRRHKWIEKNLTLVFEQFDIPPKKGWKVEPLLLVNDDIITNYFHKSPIPVLSLLRFEEDYLPNILPKNRMYSP